MDDMVLANDEYEDYESLLLALELSKYEAVYASLTGDDDDEVR